MAAPLGSRATLTLALDLSHWRRHDRAHWVQVLATAVMEAAPELLEAEGYELHDTEIYVRMRSKRPPKKLRKLWEDDESLIRLRARLVDLGARADLEIEEA
jgi:hypothetical protein